MAKKGVRNRYVPSEKSSWYADRGSEVRGLAPLADLCLLIDKGTQWDNSA